ncbi:HDOD domain-containing protein [Comamonadaceae bacterium G21597-S1]|nr:HDOD domain-containing protein [Comamonadaceae bacterium G21597-S1]
MAPSTLGHLILGYQLVWNRLRQPAAVQLFLTPHGQEPVEGAHFLRTLEQTWSEQCPPLLLAPQTTGLLTDLLNHGSRDGPHLVVQHDLMRNEAVTGAVQRAHARGVPMLWRGQPGQRPDAAMARYFVRGMLALTPGETIVGAQASLRQGQPGAQTTAATARALSPVPPDQIIEAVPSRLMADHCLDQQNAWGVAGWPVDDVLLSHRKQPIPPSHRAVVLLIQQTDADAALELIEHTLAEEPLLAYRFLRFTNSAALGLRSSVESLRHGLMLLGLSRFKAWLQEMLPLASNEPDMDPVRTGMVMRARMMENQLDAGDEELLRREVFLCGMLSQIDGLLGESLKDALHRLPLSERINGAILGNSGPYAPFLELATALEYPNMDQVPALCTEHELDLGEVNRTMLRVLTQLHKSAG